MTREYQNDSIVVMWDADRCIHFGKLHSRPEHRL